MEARELHNPLKEYLVPHGAFTRLTVCLLAPDAAAFHRRLRSYGREFFVSVAASAGNPTRLAVILLFRAGAHVYNPKSLER